MKNLICMSAPSGSGKTTLCKAIREAKPELIWSVSYTTRRPRHNEINGEDYNFISKEEFISLIDNEKLDKFAIVETLRKNKQLIKNSNQKLYNQVIN